MADEGDMHMTLNEVSDYEYTPDTFDLTNFFSVEEKLEGDGSVTTFFNLNEGVTIDGIEDLRPEQTIRYVCRSGDNLRFISFREYGSVHYWWIIAKLNHIEDCLEPLEGGRELILLPRQHMNYIMNLVTGRKSSDA
jgi:hypothetical protein